MIVRGGRKRRTWVHVMFRRSLQQVPGLGRNLHGSVQNLFRCFVTVREVAVEAVQTQLALQFGMAEEGEVEGHMLADGFVHLISPRQNLSVSGPVAHQVLQVLPEEEQVVREVLEEIQLLEQLHFFLLLEEEEDLVERIRLQYPPEAEVGELEVQERVVALLRVLGALLGQPQGRHLQLQVTERTDQRELLAIRLPQVAVRVEELLPLHLLAQAGGQYLAEAEAARGAVLRLYRRFQPVLLVGVFLLITPQPEAQLAPTAHLLCPEFAGCLAV